VKSKKWLGQFIIGLIIIAAGVFILVKRDSFLRIFVMVLGVLAITSGASSLLSMNRYAFGRYNRNATLVKGILSLVIGVLAVVLPIFTLETTWRIFMYVLAAQMLISAAITLIAAIAVRSKGMSASQMVGEGALSLFFAVFLFLFPRSIGNLLVTIFGVIVIAIGLAFVAIAFIMRNKKDPRTLHDVEVEVVSEP
jgi:uncharacterized membrane protein HdeD (DUF308 family)